MSGGGVGVDEVVAHTIGLIEPVSEVHRAAAAGRLGGEAAGGVATFGAVGALAVRLAAAQQTLALRVARRVLVVVAHDAAAARCGLDLGPAHPTATAAAALAAGTSTTAALARAAGATVVLVDAGCESSALPGLVVAVGPAAGTAGSDAARAGVALAVSLASEGVEIASVSSIGLDIGATEPGAGAAAEGVPAMTGLLLGLAAAGVPVLVDGPRAAAAAAAAVALAPSSRGYFLGVHTGGVPWPAALEPALVSGLGRGDGAGAALVMASLDQARAVLIAGPGQSQVD